MMKAAISLALAATLYFWAGAVSMAARAEEPPPPKVPAGYELLAAAGQLAKSSQALDAAAESGATLTQKRLTLSEKPVAQALTLLRRWLDTPAQPNAESERKEGSLTALLPGVRALARALTLQNYVQLADGRVSEAIDTLRDGLRLSVAIGNSSIAGWVHGVFVEGMLTVSLGQHLDQLSARDCDHLFRLAQDWDRPSTSLFQALDHSRLAQIELIQKFVEEGDYRGLIEELTDSDDVPLAMQTERLTPQAMQQLMERVIVEINTAYRQEQAALRTPYWKRTPPAAPSVKSKMPDDLLVQKFVDMVMPDLSRVTDRYARAEVMTRLLGCHAAIRRYRWEHESLPPSLATLKIGAMVIDPFTGKPFLYKIEGANYTLESLGPLARDEKGRPLPDRHTPITLTSGQ